MCRGLLLIMHSTITMWRERETDNHTDGYRNGTQHTPRHTTRVADIPGISQAQPFQALHIPVRVLSMAAVPVPLGTPCWLRPHDTAAKRFEACNGSDNHRSSSRTSIRPRGPVSINQCSLVFLFSGEKKKTGRTQGIGKQETKGENRIRNDTQESTKHTVGLQYGLFLSKQKTDCNRPRGFQVPWISQ